MIYDICYMLYVICYMLYDIHIYIYSTPFMPSYLPSIFFAASQAPKRRDGDSRLADRRPWGISPIAGWFISWKSRLFHDYNG